MIRPLTTRLMAPALFQPFFDPKPSAIRDHSEDVAHHDSKIERAASNPEHTDDYQSIPRRPEPDITAMDLTSKRETLRFGTAEQFRVARADINSPSASHSRISSSPSEIAAEVFNYIKTYDHDIAGTNQIITESIAYGKNKDLSGMFQSSAMTEILNNKNSYNTFNELFAAISSRKSELISHLSFAQKFKYGLLVSNLLTRLESKKPILEGLCSIYGRHRGIKVGTAGAELLAYFFRRDKLSSQSIAIFDHIFALIKTEARRRTR